ncbi:hypothetical protein [Ruegeria sp. Ofav3-42]|uniref:hypothetical protein n=1 Tax=Ruegeria sp. Ofav3-42 TaxID=2917759 RepID=UPI001EF5E9A0|nr:hypothetical protein [Ruegeria sp. Ofav3-42]MCG7522413.1 hypothetical protein [Ruegeria sp. Ofav3-42]
MGVLVLAVMTGSIAAFVALVTGYGWLAAWAIFVLAGLASIPLIVLPILGLCALRKRWMRRDQEKIYS